MTLPGVGRVGVWVQVAVLHGRDIRLVWAVVPDANKKRPIHLEPCSSVLAVVDDVSQGVERAIRHDSCAQIIVSHIRNARIEISGRRFRVQVDVVFRQGSAEESGW